MPHHPSPTTATSPRADRRRRGDRGLTTLEWLLIVAAVAGLAALAVVLVQNVVDDTAEQISGSSARLTAARVAAQEINDECTAAALKIAAAKTCKSDDSDDKVKNVVSEAKAKCLRLVITYGDAFNEAGISDDLLKAGPRDPDVAAERFLWDNTATNVTDKCKIPTDQA